MKSIERMQNAMKGEIPDRVPFFPTIFTDHACLVCDRPFEEALIDPAIGTQRMLDAAVKYQTDAVRFLIGPEERWYREKEVKYRNGDLIQFDKKSGNADGYFDVNGGGKFIEYNPAPYVKSMDDVTDIEVPFAGDYLDRGCFDAVKKGVDSAHEKGLFAVGMTGSQSINFMVAKMGSAEAALICFHDDPELAHALIDKAVKISLEIGKAFIETGVDCIYIGDSYASASVISPDVYETFCAPAYRTAATEFRSRGVFCYKHCCGNYNPLLKFLPSVGIDGMDGLDPTSGMSVKHTKEIVGSEITLMGGISCLTLADGTPEQVYEEAVQCINDGKEGGRYTLGSACAVPRKTPFENLFAARRAAEDHGYY